MNAFGIPAEKDLEEAQLECKVVKMKEKFRPYYEENFKKMFYV